MTRYRDRQSSLLTLAAALVLTGCRDNYKMPPPPPAPPDAANGHLKISLQLSPQPVRQMDPTTVTVHLADENHHPVIGASVSADLIMPAMDMGHNVVIAKPQGPGAYIGTARFPMDGDWRMTVTAAKGAERAVQTFPLKVR